MAIKFTGYICLDTIPAECIKKGNKGHLYVNVAIIENDTPIKDKDTGEVLADHFITCAPRREERVDGHKYIFGNVLTWQDRQGIVSAQDVNAMPPIPANPYAAPDYDPSA